MSSRSMSRVRVFKDKIFTKFSDKKIVTKVVVLESIKIAKLIINIKIRSIILLQPLNYI